MFDWALKMLLLLAQPKVGKVNVFLKKKKPFVGLFYVENLGLI